MTFYVFLSYYTRFLEHGARYRPICHPLYGINIVSKRLDGLSWFWRRGFSRRIMDCALRRFQHVFPPALYRYLEPCRFFPF